jgi:hypothetical protein
MQHNGTSQSDGTAAAIQLQLASLELRNCIFPPPTITMLAAD